MERAVFVVCFLWCVKLFQSCVWFYEKALIRCRQTGRFVIPAM